MSQASIVTRARVTTFRTWPNKCNTWQTREISRVGIGENSTPVRAERRNSTFAKGRSAPFITLLNEQCSATEISQVTAEGGIPL